MAWNDGYDNWKTAVPEPTKAEMFSEKYVEEKSEEIVKFLQRYDDLDLCEFIDWDKLSEVLSEKSEEARQDAKDQAKIDAYESRFDY